MGAKYNFTISGNSLLMQRTPISEDTQYKAISFKSPSLVQDNNKIKLFEAGEFQTSLRFIDFGLIDGISPIDLQDAKDKLLVLIGTISEGGGGAVDSVNGQTGVVVLDAEDVGAIPRSGTTVGNPITGDLEVDENIIFQLKQGMVSVYFEAGSVALRDIDSNSFFSIGGSPFFIVGSDNPSFAGIRGQRDFTPYIGDLDYTQKKYVDTKAPLTPRVQSVTSSATVTPTSTNDIVTITAQAVALTLANPTGTFAEGQALMIRIKDNGTIQAITFGSNYRAIGVTLPTTTIANKILYLGIIYDSIDAKWNILGTPQQA